MQVRTGGSDHPLRGSVSAAYKIQLRRRNHSDLAGPVIAFKARKSIRVKCYVLKTNGLPVRFGPVSPAAIKTRAKGKSVIVSRQKMAIPLGTLNVRSVLRAAGQTILDSARSRHDLLGPDAQ